MSPSGLHLGHYKALLAPDGNKKEVSQMQSEEIWTIIHVIINASIYIGDGPDRWKRVNQLMLEKIKGNNNINKLRRINLFEADYNAVLKYFWPHQVNKLDGNRINLETMQYGGRKHRKANDPTMINEMILDFHRMSYKQITIVQQYLASCFDRTIQNITNICNQKYHIPIEVCRLNTKI